MEAQPQLLLLQKNMLMAEGVSRQLNPTLNIWTLAQPLVEQWMRENRGPEARIAEGTRELVRIAGRLPELIADMEAAASTARRGIKLHPDTLAALSEMNRTDRRSITWHDLARHRRCFWPGDADDVPSPDARRRPAAPMSMKRTALLTGLWSLGESWGFRIVSAVVFLLLARLIEPAAFGLAALAQVYLVVVQTLCDQGSPPP